MQSKLSNTAIAFGVFKTVQAFKKSKEESKAEKKAAKEKIDKMKKDNADKVKDDTKNDKKITVINKLTDQLLDEDKNRKGGVETHDYYKPSLLAEAVGLFTSLLGSGEETTLLGDGEE